jgi:hypothetical protein
VKDGMVIILSYKFYHVLIDINDRAKELALSEAGLSKYGLSVGIRYIQVWSSVITII